MDNGTSGGIGLPERMVGIFWRVPGHPSGFRILSLSLPLSRALPYGSHLTVSTSHYEFWEQLQRRPRSWFAKAGVSAAVWGTEYEEWPRGRVVHSTETGRSAIMLDPSLFPPRAIEAVARRFRLPAGSYDVAYDSHYRATGLTKPPPADL